QYAEKENVAFLKAEGFKAITGKGVEGMVNGKKIAVGNLKLMQDLDSTLSTDLKEKVINEQKLGKTVSYLSIDGRGVGFVVISDAIKQSSKKAIKELMDGGMEVIMLTGDNSDTAKAVASELNLAAYKADVLPEDK